MGCVIRREVRIPGQVLEQHTSLLCRCVNEVCEWFEVVKGADGANFQLCFCQGSFDFNRVLDGTQCLAGRQHFPKNNISYFAKTKNQAWVKCLEFRILILSNFDLVRLFYLRNCSSFHGISGWFKDSLALNKRKKMLMGQISLFYPTGLEIRKDG